MDPSALSNLDFSFFFFFFQSVLVISFIVFFDHFSTRLRYTVPPFLATDSCLFSNYLRFCSFCLTSRPRYPRGSSGSYTPFLCVLRICERPYSLASSCPSDLLPSAKIYALGDKIPFHLQLADPASCLAQSCLFRVHHLQVPIDYSLRRARKGRIRGRVVDRYS
jgi:hypothetical protein